MNITSAKGLCADLLDAGAGFTIYPNPEQSGDWLIDVIAPTGVTVDAKQIAGLETRWSCSAPVTTIRFK